MEPKFIDLKESQWGATVVLDMITNIEEAKKKRKINFSFEEGSVKGLPWL